MEERESLSEPLTSTNITTHPNCLVACIPFLCGTRYRVTTRSVEIRTGCCCLSSVDTVELWRAHDVRFTPSACDFCIKKGTVSIFTDDVSDKEYHLYGVSYFVHDSIRDTVDSYRASMSAQKMT